MKPEIVQKCPFAVEVTEGQTYYWCSCGLSKKQPFAMADIRELSLGLRLTRLQKPK